ncbi:DUF3108 domain-containing protein [Oleiharenicola lentus]|uniref:DUF3108 domain-containing protein n=1 Tax=Oleiharenicola lentus TaxID=2508720 RepID=A0A4Q1CA78_9BACT|nr:DUF3108 domain-containing protein [Oleiharenicola lentus]
MGMKGRVGDSIHQWTGTGRNHEIFPAALAARTGSQQILDARAPFALARVFMAVKISLLSFLLPGFALAAPFVAIRDGESFTYKVGFSVFSHAGDIEISGANPKDTADRIAITVDTRSRGFVRGLYEFDNKAVADVELSSGRLLRVTENGSDPKRPIDTKFVIDYTARTATFTDRVRTGRSNRLTLPEGGDPIDLISALVQTRDWNLKPGEKREVVVQFGRDFYPITILAEGYEEVRTPLGRYRTLVLVPRMEKEPKGLFKRGGEVKVWIAQDGSRLPVKMQLKLNFGAATLLLSKYQPPKG